MVSQRELAIKKTQQENFIKCANEKKLFEDNPNLKQEKDDLIAKIYYALEQLEYYQSMVETWKNKLTLFAEQAIKLQEKGIFWAEKEFSVCKASTFLDYQQIFDQLPFKIQKQYGILKPNGKALKNKFFPIIKESDSKPSIKSRKEKEKDENDGY